MISIVDTDTLRAAVGTEIGISRWRTVTQGDVDTYAALTGDDQWIHVDVDKAAASAYGSTIVHALLTLGYGPKFLYELLDWSTATSSVNYGFNKVRVPAPLPTGSRIRMRLGLQSIEDVRGGHQLTFVQTFERDGGQKPVCVAEFIARIFP